MNKHTHEVTAGGVISVARLISDMETLFQRVSTDVDVPKKAIQALLLMSADGSSRPFSNRWLQDQFLVNRLSSHLSASKDSSTAKSDLLKRKLIEIGQKVSEFVITERGRAVVSEVVATISSSVDDMQLLEQERLLVQHVMCSSAKIAAKKPPESAGIHMFSNKAVG